MRNFLGEKGAIKPIVSILLIVLLVYIGYKFAIPYYKYTTLKSEAKQIARLELHNTKRVQNMVFKKAKALKVPIKKEDIHVRVAEEMITIRTSWSETVDILGIYQKNLIFTIDITQ